MDIGRGAVWVLAVLVVCAPAALAQSDTEPPVLVGFDFNPKSIDVTQGGQWVYAEISASDAGGSGICCMWLRFNSPSGSHYSTCTTSTPDSGDQYNGTWICDAYIPDTVEGGVWSG